MSSFTTKTDALHFGLASSSGGSGSKLATTDTIKLHNPLSHSVTFKVKTTSPDRYIVRPNIGILEAGKSVDVVIAYTVHHGSNEKGSGGGKSGDKFKVMIAKVGKGFVVEDDGLGRFWKTVKKAEVCEKVFLVEFEDGGVVERGILGEDNVVKEGDGGDVKEVNEQKKIAGLTEGDGISLGPVGMVERERFKGRPEVEERIKEHDRHEAELKKRIEELDREKAKDRVSPREVRDEVEDMDSLREAERNVEGLQRNVDGKDRELARLRMEVEEKKAETKRILKSVPKAPLSANKFVADPYGGVSLAQVAVMILLAAVLAKVFLF